MLEMRPRDGDVHDTASPTLSVSPSGMLPLEALQQIPVLIRSGPTGRSFYWNDCFGALDPALATTDPGYNRVDRTWMPTTHCEVRLLLMEPADPEQPPLADVVRRLREQVGLPAAHVAAMLGVKRRQLYNLLERGRATSDRERWIHALAGHVDVLADAANGDPDAVRAAVLRPLPSGQTFFSHATELDEPGVARATAELLELMSQGRLRGRARRPAPSLKRRGREGATSDFLSGYRGSDADA